MISRSDQDHPLCVMRVRRSQKVGDREIGDPVHKEFMHFETANPENPMGSWTTVTWSDGHIDQEL
jgi:hypothetical protein